MRLGNDQIMDSTEDYDATLPLDMDRSSINISRFDDHTAVGLSSTMSDPGQTQMANGYLLAVPDGRMSPSSSRTMKDFATQISDLKKENFSLKLRIFHMEERMQEGFNNDSEHVFKTNIELKVECDSLRKELEDKHDLLIRASNAVACMEAAPEESRKIREDAQRELQQMRDAMNEKIQQADKDLRAARTDAERLADDVHQLQEYSRKLEGDNQKLVKELEDGTKENDALRESMPKVGETVKTEEDISNLAKLDSLEQEIAEKDRLIEQLHDGLSVKQIMIETLTEEKKADSTALDHDKDNIANLENKNKALNDELHKTRHQDERLKSEYSAYRELEHEYQQHIFDQQQKLDEYEIAARQMSVELEKREEEVQDLTEALQDAELTGKQLAEKLENLAGEKSKKDSKEIIMRDKAIAGLTDVVKQKEDEIDRLAAEAKRREIRLDEMAETIHKLNIQETTLRNRVERLDDLEQQVQELSSIKRNLEVTNERLVSEIGDGEELVRSLDEKLKEKDVELQELVTKYKELLKKQREDELAKAKALRDQENIADQFEKEKREFADIMNGMKQQSELTSKQDSDKARAKDIAELQDKLQAVENLLRLKESQLQDSISLCKRAEQERLEALEELDAAVKRRDHVQLREAESRTRINAAKSAEIDRLREELRNKDESLQNLEDDLLHAERSAHEAAEKSTLAGREAARWKEDSQHKAAVIEQLMENLKSLGDNSSNSDQEQIIKLTRENVELKQLLKAREAELSFVRNEQSSNDPYVESLKREISRKDKIIADERQLQETLHNAFVNWSKISEDTADMNLTLDTLRLEIESHKRELNGAKTQVGSLNAQLESGRTEMLSLREELNAKDRMLEDLRAGQRFPTVESEEVSSCANEKPLHGRLQRFRKKKSKRPRADDESSVASSANSLMRFVADSEFDFVSGRDTPASEDNILSSELLGLRKEIEDLKEHQRSEIDLRRASSKLDVRKERLRRLAKSLSREQKLYRKQLHAGQDSGSKGSAQREKMLDGVLAEVEELRNKLADLLLDMPHTEADKTEDDFSACSTILPIDQTSYLQVPPAAVRNQANNQERGMRELQEEMEKLRNDLLDACSKLSEWEKERSEWEAVRNRLEQDNKETNDNLEKAMKRGELKDSEMSELRIEVDRLRALQLRVTRLSDMELRESIDNLEKKLKNSEKLNELLGDQIESARGEKSARRSEDPELARQLTLQIGRLQEQLRNAQRQLRDAQADAAKSGPADTSSRSDPVLIRGQSKSKLPVPVDKAQLKNTDSNLACDGADVAKIDAENARLRNKLAATEETVRQQTEKLKKAKSAISSAGLDFPISPVKSARSHPNLFFNGNAAGLQRDSSDTADGRVQMSADDTGYASVTSRSEKRYNSLIQAQAKELSTLRQRLKRARGTCKDLKTEYDIVLRYVSTLLASDGPVDTMLATSVTGELRRCKQLTRKLKDQLAEWVTGSATSSDCDESDSSREMSPTRRQTSQIIEKNQEIEEKNRRIRDLEEKLQDLLRQYEEPSFPASKGQRIIPENLGYLTPASSLGDREETVSPIMRAASSRNTEYAALPEPRTPRPRSAVHRPGQTYQSSPRLNKTLPLYQRTVAITEYLPFRDAAESNTSARRRLSSTLDAENCSASYGGCWSLGVSPRQGQEIGITFNPELSVHSSPSDRRDGGLEKRLEDSERLNQSLKEELDITMEALTQAKNSERSNRSPADVLEEHLREIRVLRQRLENSINTNDNLRRQLESKLNQTAQGEHVAANIYLPVNAKEGTRYGDEMAQAQSELFQANEKIAQLQTQLEAEMKVKENYAAAAQELERLNDRLSESSTQTELLASMIGDMEQAIADKDDEIRSLSGDLKKSEEELKCAKDRHEVNVAEAESLRQNADEANRCASSLREDLSRVNEELDESQGLVKSLKSELALYEKYYRNEGGADARSRRSFCGQTSNLTFDPKHSSTLHDVSRHSFDPDHASESRSRFNPDSARSQPSYSRRGSRPGLVHEESIDPVRSNPVFGRGEPGFASTGPESRAVLEFDISEFLDEIRSLRVQLERSIEINSALRRQLQEQLQHDKDWAGAASPGRTTTINIHHVSPNAGDQVGTGGSSSRACDSGVKRKLDLSKDTFGHRPMTPPPSASSYGCESFEFATLPGHDSRNAGLSPVAGKYPCYDTHGSYVIGNRKDYKELRQIVSDGRMLLNKMESKSADRATQHKSPRKQSFGDIGGDVKLLQRTMDDCRRLLKLFWPASVRQVALSSADVEDHKRSSRRLSDASSDVSKGTRDAGFASDTSINSEADGLRREVNKLHKRLSAQDKLLQSTVDRLQSANRLKEGIEHAILKQLTVTHDVLKKARGNLEAKTGDEKPKSKH